MVESRSLNGTLYDYVLSWTASIFLVCVTVYVGQAQGEERP